MISLTLTFTQPVQNLSLTITDIDQTPTQWIDDGHHQRPAGIVRSPVQNNVHGRGHVGEPASEPGARWHQSDAPGAP